MTVSKIQHPSFQKISAPKKVSWSIFEKKYLTREDSWKYEWVNGIIEKTKRTIYPLQYYILQNLRKLFSLLSVEKKVSGGLEAETDLFLSEKIHRRPDISYFNDHQIALMAHGALPVPEFVIDVISKTGNLHTRNRKMKNYRDAGIKVVWEIFPETKEVIITLGKDSTTCTGEDICSAAPVLPDFKISVNALFHKPPKPAELK